MNNNKNPLSKINFITTYLLLLLLRDVVPVLLVKKYCVAYDIRQSQHDSFPNRNNHLL